jgi:hypothetical protein
MNDQGVERRSSLGFVNAGNCLSIGRIGGQAINCLGRHGDGFALKDQPGGFGDRFVAER